MAFEYRSVRMLALATLVAGFTGISAMAATIQGTFNLSGAAFGTNAGLITKTNVASGGFNVNLTNGQSTTFNLFHIWTDEPTVDPDDLISRALLAAFTVTGSGSSDVIAGAVQGNKSGVLQWGSASWAAPIVLDLGNGGQLLVSLGNTIFNLGSNRRLAPGTLNGSDVQATLTYTIAPVPVPAAGLLLLGGFGALGAVRRRKQA